MARQGLINKNLFSVVGLFVLAVLLFSAQGWCSCRSFNDPYECDRYYSCFANVTGGSGSVSCSYGPSCGSDRTLCSTTNYCAPVDCGGVIHKNSVYLTGGVDAHMNSNYCQNNGSSCSNVTLTNYNSCGYTIVCTTQCEADSVACTPDKGQWNSDSCRCESCQGAECCSSDEVYYPGTDECLPKCKTQYCCDSLNRNVPATSDTSWLGCKDDGTGGCDVFTSGQNATATCTGVSEYEVCTTRWYWSQSAKQCGLLSTQNCVKFTRHDSNCDSILCTSIVRTSIGGTTYNYQTGCYEVKTQQTRYMDCSNGIHDAVDVGEWVTKSLCDNYLDSLGVTVDQYLSGGGSGGGGLGGGAGGDVGGGGYPGGPGVDNQGNPVDNMPSPNSDSYSTTEPVVVTRDSSGTTVIVPNTSGGDSVAVTPVQKSVTCVGHSNGVATLSNGYSSWSCEAMSCSQAMLSYSMGGVCAGSNEGPGGGGLNDYSVKGDLDSSRFIADSLLTIDYSDQINRINNNVSNMYNSWMITGDYPTFSAGIGAVVAAVNANTYKDSVLQDRDSKTRDSLWHVTFGNDLSAVLRLSDSLNAVKTAVNEVNTSVGDVNTSVGQVKTAVNDVNTSVGQVRTAVNNVNASVGDVRTAVNDVNASVGQVKTSVDNFKSALVDSVHTGNGQLRSIFSVLDTGGGMRNAVNAVRDSVHSVTSAIGGLPRSIDSVFSINFDNYYNDKLSPKLDTAAGRIVDALDSFSVEINTDSLPTRGAVDSINSAVHPGQLLDMTVSQDSIDFGEIMKTAYDSSYGDTTYEKDSSFAEYMRAQASNTVDGSDVSDGSVDSLENTLSASLDSSQAKLNLRSDTMVMALKDSMMKYYGVDSIGNSLNSFFGGYSSGCPKNCLDVTIIAPVMTGGRDVKVALSYYICEMAVVGSYTILDFIKLILKIYTSFLCMMLILRVVPLKGGSK